MRLTAKSRKDFPTSRRGGFILVKPNIDASIARKENGKKFGKLGGRPPKKGKTASSAKSKSEAPTPPSDYSLSLEQEIEQMKTDHTWNEPVCMQFHISADELAKRLDTFHNHCKCENDGKAHSNINDAKRHFCSWMRKAYTQIEHDSDTELPPPSYEFNGGFGGQDI